MAAMARIVRPARWLQRGAIVVTVVEFFARRVRSILYTHTVFSLEHVMGAAIPDRIVQRTRLAAEITTLYAHINAATARLLELIAEFDAVGGYADDGALSTAHWLGWACGIGPTAAREKVRVARALQELPATRAAFQAGTVSYSKVRALTRVATPACEATLLDMARHATAGQTERIMRNYRQALSLGEGMNGQNRPEQELSCLWDGEGCLVIRGRLAPDQGALFLKALERAWCELKDEEPPAEETVGTRCFHPGHSDDHPVSERRADALVVLAERSLEAAAGDSATADRFQVSISVSAETLTTDSAHPTEPAEPAEIDDGPVIGHERIRRLTCDASVVPILESEDGNLLSVGRKTRTVPPALRRALKRRDGGCRFPGCQQRHYVDAHHIEHWADGGETRLDNLVLLCRRHHRMLHEGGYTIRALDDAGMQFLYPDGRVIPATAEDLSRGDCETLVAEVRRHSCRHGDSAESSLDGSTLTADLDWRPPDYPHIAWWMTTFMSR